MSIIEMRDAEVEGNLDLGRHITYSDIVCHPNVMPMDIRDEGVYCYCCQQENGHSTEHLTPLTKSSGVFTDNIHCNMDSPVWVCLEHIPFSRNQFEAFTPEVAEQLRKQKSLRD